MRGRGKMSREKYNVHAVSLAGPGVSPGVEQNVIQTHVPGSHGTEYRGSLRQSSLQGCLVVRRNVWPPRGRIALRPGFAWLPASAFRHKGSAENRCSNVVVCR